MRVKIFVLILLLAIASKVSAECYFAYDFSEPEQSVSGTVIYVLPKSLDFNQLNTIIEYSFDSESLDGQFDLMFGKAYMNLTGSVKNFPLFVDLKKVQFRFGIETLYHLQWFYSCYVEHDFLFNLCWEIDNPVAGVFGISIGETLKISDIFVLESTIKDICPALKVSYKKVFSNGVQVLAMIGSYDSIDFPIFGTVHYTLQGGYKVGPQFTLNLLTEFRICDQFTTTPYFNMFTIGMTGRYHF